MRQYHRQLLKKLCDETGLMSSVFYLPAEEFITRMRVGGIEPGCLGY